MEKSTRKKLYWKGFKSKAPLSFLGLIFILFTLLIIIPALIILSSMLRQPFEKYDYEKIFALGQSYNAKIKHIQIKDNISFNGINPRVITYQYSINSKTIIDYFQTLNVNKVNELNKMDSIPILVLEDQSVVKNIEPYTFPFIMLWTVPTIFLVFGIPFFTLGHIAGLKNIRRLSKHED